MISIESVLLGKMVMLMTLNSLITIKEVFYEYI